MKHAASARAAISKTVLTVSEVNQNFSRARKAVLDGPVMITDHGKPALVLMRYEDYAAPQDSGKAFLERIDVPGTEDIDFELQERTVEDFRPIDLD